MLKHVFSAALAFSLALACLGDADITPDPTLEPANLDLAKNQLRIYVGSGAYARSVAEIALRANKFLVKRIAHGAKPGKKLAVVFDIDETTLSNLPHIIAHDYGFVPKAWDAWVLQGQARAIIPVQTVYDTAVRGKVDVFFITTRPESSRASTEKNLREVGYDTWTRIFFPPATGPTLTTSGFKTDVRRKLVKEGYVIVLNIGDQDSDLAGGYAERSFKLPNPFYIMK